MIFVTVGTEKFPFNRLIRGLDTASRNGLLQDKIFAQTGKSTYKPESFPCKDFLNFDELASNMKAADIIVCHAGAGSTILSLESGKIPVLFPRRHCFGEHLDDHQVYFAEKVQEAGKAVVAYNEEDLIEKINNYEKIVKNMPPVSRGGKERLAAYLKQVIR